MTVVLYRPSLDARSGAGQLLEMQWRGLNAAGMPAVSRASEVRSSSGCEPAFARAAAPCASSSGSACRVRWSSITACASPSAELVFVHNLATEAERHLPHADAAAARSASANFSLR